MKLKAEEIAAILSKSIETALGTTEAPESKETDRIAAVEKSITSVSAQIESLAKMAATGFEKPKTQEELMAEMGKSLKEEILAALKPTKKKLKKEVAEGEEAEGEETEGEETEGEEAEAPEMPETTEDLQKMIANAVKVALKKAVKKPAPKGKGKDGLEKEIEDGEEAEHEFGVEVTEEFRKETTDEAGNELSKEQRINRAAFDDFFGKKIGHVAAMSADEEFEIDDAVFEDD